MDNDDNKQPPAVQVAFDPPMVYAPAEAMHGASADANGTSAPPGYVQFAITDDRMPAGSKRDPAFIQPGHAEQVVTDRVGEYCYLCNSGARGASEYYAVICRMWREWSTARLPSAAAADISEYYNRKLRPEIPGSPLWTPDVVYRHFVYHTVSEFDTLVRQAREYAHFSQILSNSACVVDEHGRPTGVKDSVIKTLIAVNKHEIDIMKALGGRRET